MKKNLAIVFSVILVGFVVYSSPQVQSIITGTPAMSQVEEDSADSIDVQSMIDSALLNSVLKASGDRSDLASGVILAFTFTTAPSQGPGSLDPTSADTLVKERLGGTTGTKNTAKLSADTNDLNAAIKQFAEKNPQVSSTVSNIVKDVNAYNNFVKNPNYNLDTAHALFDKIAADTNSLKSVLVKDPAVEQALRKFLTDTYDQVLQANSAQDPLASYNNALKRAKFQTQLNALINAAKAGNAGGSNSNAASNLGGTAGAHVGTQGFGGNTDINTGGFGPGGTGSTPDSPAPKSSGGGNTSGNAGGASSADHAAGTQSGSFGSGTTNSANGNSNSLGGGGLY